METEESFRQTADREGFSHGLHLRTKNSHGLEHDDDDEDDDGDDDDDQMMVRSVISK